ncbi:hypothetical protein [Pseudorhodobacter sp.]|uniref:hypothetical protein n=1 Tax=Pseudorhodobacter sp. TaxID=1934400 RepID=UPI002AFF782A|nr:hypothetical protein [Pseudorhodobacter sp.]
MNRALISFLGLSAIAALAACTDGLSPYDGNPNTVIATGIDKGRDTGVLNNGRAAIAYDPDGCQNWVIDDGVEGYASPRFDPVSGLPICNNLYPPGTVIRDYQSNTEGINDYVPGPGRRTVVVRR